MTTVRAKRAPKTPRIPAPLERQEQAAFVQWLELAVGPKGYFHVPNEGNRGRIGGAIAKGQGLRKGVPDLVITRRCPWRPEVRGIAVEMKRRHGSVTSEEQKAWIAALREDGWAASVAEGWDEARRFVESFGFSTERRFTPRHSDLPTRTENARGERTTSGGLGGGAQ